ncbi:MAG: flagellar biosynthetic protein FliR [Candidatus Marinimicrobia bacterium]|nr:flagellar biosynthetic protein FliR [Candidatus Neomarinimicrobiota bacterium]MCH7858379.1 flagellar biosynthetic protein FliR [Candidatus Neomarinimicrobiota bacterium]
MLVLIRLSAMIYAFPFFGSPAITGRVKIMITLVLSFMILPLAGIDGLGLDWGLGQLTLSVGRELGLGLVVGFGSKFMFEAFALAGTFAGRQMGFAMADLIDPVTSAPQSMVGQFWALLAILLFLAVDGHHFLIRLMIQNFQIIPLGVGQLRPATGRLLITGSSDMFQLALRLAAPALMLTLMMDVGMAILSRAMPRFQIFFVALPLKLYVGIFSLVVTLQLFQALFTTVFADFQEYLVDLLATMR